MNWKFSLEDAAFEVHKVLEILAYHQNLIRDLHGRMVLARDAGQTNLAIAHQRTLRWAHSAVQWYKSDLKIVQKQYDRISKEAGSHCA